MQVILLSIMCVFFNISPPSPEVMNFMLNPPRVIEAEITAYNENCPDGGGSMMANGERVHYGALANDQLPIGTKVIIDGEIFEIKDRFGAGNPEHRFDMYIPGSRGNCERFGRQTKVVQILED